MANWFVTFAGTELGPLNDAQLRALVASGKLSGDDLVRKEGVARAFAAKQIRGLFPAAQTPSPPPPPSSPPERGTFAEWYGGAVGRWFIPFQIVAWLFYGFLWIPAWWGFTLLNSVNPVLVRKGKRVMTGVVCGLIVILIPFVSNFRDTNRRIAREVSQNPASAGEMAKMAEAASLGADGNETDSPASKLTFKEFRREAMGRTFHYKYFLEKFGPPVKTIPPADVQSPMAKQMFAVDHVHQIYQCKDEPAIVQYKTSGNDMTIIAVIKAKDITLLPPSSWKNLEY